MSAPAKYLFDTLLDAPVAPPPIAFDDVEEMKALHAAELTRIREEALEQGRKEGRLEAQDSLERELFRHLDQLVKNKEDYQDDIDAKLHAARRSSVLLAMTIAKKLAGALLAKYPFEHIEQFFSDTLSLLPDKTALRLHVAPELASTLQPRLLALLERNGQENTLLTVEDETIEGVNCRLTWIDGGIEQNTDDIYSRIENMIETCLFSQAEPSETKSATDIARPTI